MRGSRCCAAFLFAAHPVHTEAVASVVGRAELLAALLALLAWWIVLARRSVSAHVAAALVLLAGVLAKENADRRSSRSRLPPT